jgi:hypothetical protein
MNTKLDALDTVKNESGSAKYENGTRRSLPPKMSPQAQNMNTRPGALGTAQNGSGSPKHEDSTQRPRYRRKRVRKRKT